jgi:hypothetical protein
MVRRRGAPVAFGIAPNCPGPDQGYINYETESIFDGLGKCP